MAIYKFSVAWCQPIGLMQVVGREGECSSQCSAVFFLDTPPFIVGGCYFYQITSFCNDLNSKLAKCTTTNMKILTLYIIINQRDATVRSQFYFILLQDHSTCFGCCPHPSSGVHIKAMLEEGSCNDI